MHCIEEISRIIQSRDTECVPADDVVDTNLDTLPLHVIGHCASFLDHKSYARFSRLNRSTYSGCNTPIMLAELVVKYPKIPTIDLSSFAFAKHLSLCVGDLKWCTKHLSAQRPQPMQCAGSVCGYPSVSLEIAR